MGGWGVGGSRRSPPAKNGGKAKVDLRIWALSDFNRKTSFPRPKRCVRFREQKQYKWKCKQMTRGSAHHRYPEASAAARWKSSYSAVWERRDTGPWCTGTLACGCFTLTSLLLFFSSPAPSVSSPATLDATPRTWRRWVVNLATKTQIENKLKTVLVCGKLRFNPLRSKLWSLNWNRESPGDSWIFFFNLHWTQMIPPLFPEREKKSHRATESL